MTTISFLQTEAWQKFQESLGRKTFRDQGSDWQYLAVLEKGFANTRLYTPSGPACRDITSFKKALDSLRHIAHKNQVDFIRIEPQFGVSKADLKKLGFKPVDYQQLQPSHTRIIDLRRSKDEILASMSQPSRNITRNYHKKGLKIRSSKNPEDINILINLLKNVARRNHISVHSNIYFQKQAETLFPIESATLYIASVEDKDIAAALVYDSADTRIYAHAAADDNYRKFNAGTAIVGQMILDAKELGLNNFDLYGVSPPEQQNHPWIGFSKFKASFGGELIAYPGAWDLPLNPLRYLFYRLYQSARKFLKKR